MSNSNRFKEKFKQADAAFKGIYKNELEELMGLSKREIDSLTPDGTDLRVYTVLTEVVKEASSENISQAELVNNIKDLGEVAIRIAKKIPGLATLL